MKRRRSPPQFLWVLALAVSFPLQHDAWMPALPATSSPSLARLKLQLADAKSGRTYSVDQESSSLKFKVLSLPNFLPSFSNNTNNVKVEEKDQPVNGAAAVNGAKDDSGFFGFFRRKNKDERTKEDDKPKKSAKKPKSKKETNKKDEEKEENNNKFYNPFAVAFAVTQQFVSKTFFSGNGKSTNDEEWVAIFPKTRLSPGQIVPATVCGIDLLVIASKDGRKLYCIANSCPHLGTPLETGKLVRLPIETTPLSSSSSSSFSSKTKANADKAQSTSVSFTETDISQILQQDGCEDCIVCPLHQTAFALESGEVRGEWCPYPPVVGKLVGALKQKSSVAVFDIRTQGKDIQVRLNTPLEVLDNSNNNSKKKKSSKL